MKFIKLVIKAKKAYYRTLKKLIQINITNNNNNNLRKFLTKKIIVIKITINL